VRMKDPLLSELIALLARHNAVEAAKKYQEATKSVLVGKILDAQHPTGKP
jgi:hypothetical protein